MTYFTALGNWDMPHFSVTEKPVTSAVPWQWWLPEQVWGPNDGQVFGVHVSDAAERSQTGEVPHEEFQCPGNLESG